MRMILSDPMFKRMEAVLRAREADAAAGAFNDGGDRNFSMNAVSSAAAADAGVADGVGGGNSVGSVADVWRGRGFGLGPTDYRGYDGGILERSAAHRVWCLATQVRSALVTLCSKLRNTLLHDCVGASVDGSAAAYPAHCCTSSRVVGT